MKLHSFTELPLRIWGLFKPVRTKTVWGEDIWIAFPEGRMIHRNGMYDSGEVETFEYLRDRLNSGDTFLNVGANIGFYAMLGAYKGAQTYAFEPFPKTFEILKKNAKNFTAVPLALTDKRGEYRMNDRGLGQRGLNEITFDGTVKITATTLDEYCKEFDIRPTFIKVDAEGSELKVVQGGIETIKRHLPALMLEVNDTQAKPVEAILYPLGYKCVHRKWDVVYTHSNI